MEITARNISQMLSARAEEVAHMLFPQGKRHGVEFHVGSLLGEPGDSLRIRMTGDKAGLWGDFTTGSEKGDLLDLWKMAKNISLGEAIREAKKWLGLQEPTFSPPRKTYTPPKAKGVAKLVETSPVLRYLTVERRLHPSTILTFNVKDKDNGKSYALPYYAPNKKDVLLIKYIDVLRDENGRKIVNVTPDCPKCLFGWQAAQDSRTCIITEGEIDAMTMHQYTEGTVPVFSIPFGAGKGGKHEWIDFEWENLQQFDLIYLCFDGDEYGLIARREVAERLGIHRTKVIDLPFKDPNECLQNGVTGDVIAAAMVKAKSFSPPEICDTTHYIDSCLEYFYPTGGKPAGFHPPLLNGAMGFRPGDVTVWTGISGHGKSLLLGELMLYAAAEGERTAIASLEMKPFQTLGRMLRQAWADETPKREELVHALEWMKGRIWIYDVMGNIAPKKLLELMKYSRCRHGVNHFVIDSLMKIGISSEDYDGQRVFLNDLVSFAKSTLCHVHLVAHARKGKDEHAMVGKMDIAGSSNIFNQADNVLVVWRNKGVEGAPEAMVICEKQREGGWEGKVPLSFIRYCSQFVRAGCDVPTVTLRTLFSEQMSNPLRVQYAEGI